MFLVEGTNKAYDEVYGYMGRLREVDYFGYLDPSSLRFDIPQLIGHCVWPLPSLHRLDKDRGICTASALHSIL